MVLRNPSNLIKTHRGHVYCVCVLTGTAGMHAAPTDACPRPPTQRAERTRQEED